jgi:hypothetical protein
MDSLPLISMNAERAARQVVDAAEAGQSQIMLGLAAKLAVRFHGLAPGTTADILGTVNRLLPGPGGVGKEAIRGSKSESIITRSWVTRLTQQAARRNNEVEQRVADRVSEG